MSVGAGVNERLAALTAAGTSVWLDQIRRSLITSGELERLERELSLRGVTSNPAIFEKAILGSTDYDEQIAELAPQGLSAREIYDEIAVLDVQLACDVLRPVWDEADHADGFVSLEVEPAFAHDTDATLKQAHEYWERVDRPNLMIKIPGTEAGVPAIEEAIAAGINVNVTLLFSVESYTAIAEAFIRGMERRLEAGESLDVHSVASFFVSRVDTEVDKRLAESGHEELRGIAAVANARAAYQRFKELFRGERFAALRDAGAMVQRPLWASTGVKDPHYPETKYVDSLVAPDTVNTMPMPTLNACAEELEVSGATADQDPTRGPRAPRGRGHRHGRRDEDAAARGHREVRGPLRRADRRHRAGARGDRHGQAQDDQVRAPRRARAAGDRARADGGARERGEADLGARRVALGRPGRARDRQPARLAHDQREDARARRRPSRVRGCGQGGRPRARRAPRDGRVEPRPRGDPALVRRRARRHAAARARLDRPRRGARHRAGGGPRQDAVHRLLEVGRHRRDALAHALLLRAHGRRRLALLRGHRPGQPAGGAGPRARLPARVRERPQHRRPLLGALLLRPRAGGAAPA